MGLEDGGSFIMVFYNVIL